MLLLRSLAAALKAPRTPGAPARAPLAIMPPKRKASAVAAAAAADEAAEPSAAGQPLTASASKRRAAKCSPAKPSSAAKAPAAAEVAEPEPTAAAPPKVAAARKRAPKAAKPPPGPVFSASMRPPPLNEGRFKILSWNVAGLRALLKKDPQAISSLVEAEQPDVVCLQEHKLQEANCAELTQQLGLPHWHCEWNCSRDKKGYSGVALLSRTKPLSVTMGLDITDHDGEGRVICAEYEWGFLVNCYVPNSGEGLKRLDYRVERWDPALASYLKQLEERKPVVLTGDLNCAPQEIDIHNPRGNLRSAGFTQEERDSFAANLLGRGFVDTFRRQYPEVVGYTYWSYRFNARANNRGWRLDMFLASSSLVEEGRVHETYHLPDRTGSDHCPIGLVLKLT